MSSLCGGDSHPSSTFKPFLNNHNYQNAASMQGHGIEEPEMEDAHHRQLYDDQSAAAKTLKRPRLVWTPQLHKRFVDVVAHLGLKNAVPKTIMLDVEGLIESLWLNGQKLGVIQNMTFLKEVWLHGNGFSGPLPDFSGLKNMESLRDNSFTGPVPLSLGRDPQPGDDSIPDPYPQLRFSSPITDFEIISLSELNGCKIHFGLAALQLEQGMGLKSSIVILEVSFMDEDAGVHTLSNVCHVDVERISKRKPGEVVPVPDAFYGGYGVVEGATLLEEEVALAATEEEEEMHE
ncbi:unnamed protein product [Fraxinus pennsylvanica]|uniref:Uncharacterized protein n=1 Tax=Fraxinus pennsylvanica TaxID=56036 RepID=A0AAD1YUJ8_9LAMI|nr:unnamed protein product [Fraxinus pennsylvanica]